MKEKRSFPYVVVNKKQEATLKKNYPWVYGEEITERQGNFENGCITDVFNEKGSYLGSGLYSEHSKISIRILSRNANESFSDAFWKRRIQYALDYRFTVMQSDEINCCRLIFGEADGFPGLTVDRFNHILVTQVLSYGIDIRKDLLYSELVSQLKERGEDITGIYERNDSSIRDLEGLKRYEGWYEGLPHPESTGETIVENGITYLVDFKDGQKTGYFLDQKFNRRAVGSIAKNKTVLDCCTHTGSFALNAAKGGAKHVTAVDISAFALDQAKKHAEINGLSEKMDFIQADVFDLLDELKTNRKYQYDFIILDPPAFTKSRKTIDHAEKGYREINRKAMQLLPRGGYLATCSCSHFMSRERFEAMLQRAAEEANVELKQIECRQQGRDHPILWNVPETNYLKFYLFQIL